MKRQLPHLGNLGQGVNRKLPHLGDLGQGVNRKRLDDLGDYLRALSVRLRSVRICCGDWSRVCGPTPTVRQGLTGVFLDPPYAVEDRANCYDSTEDFTVANSVREWCKEWGKDSRMRIALCGYEIEHAELEPLGWSVHEWKAKGGYASQGDGENENCKRERIWFSPNCITVKQAGLFGGTP
jgi:site-specific DNA-adenine methylase